jgi:hypothetical protein
MSVAKPVVGLPFEAGVHDVRGFDRFEVIAGILAKVACFGRRPSRHDGQMSMVQEFEGRTGFEGSLWALFQMFSRYTLRDQLESERFDLSHISTHQTA